MMGWEYLDFSSAIGTLYMVVVITTIIVVILDNRNPVKTLSWVLVLSFLPMVGLVLYFFFGRDTRHEKLISKKGFARLTKHPMQEYQLQESFKNCNEQYPVMRFFKNVNESLPFEGNEIKMYTCGKDMFSDLLEAVSNAKHHIHVQFYIFEADRVGSELRDALIEKAKEGVEVRFLYDDVGSWMLPLEFVEEMRDAGIEARSFLKVRFPRFTGKVNYRNHRKVVVVDGHIGFVGGMNIAKRYLDGLEWGIWKDLHMRVTGKAVYGLQTSFLTDWYAMDQSLLTSSVYFPSILPKGNVVMQIATSDPIGKWRDVMQGMLMVIASARKYLYIQTPYLLPAEPILLALKTAALAGVDVRIMIPMRADSKVTHLGSLSYLSELMEAGVKMYLYESGFLHAKMLVCDDLVSSVGSSNIDFRSFEHNFEINAFMYGVEPALLLKRIFVDDQKSSMLLNLKVWNRRPWYQKVLESVIRLFAPLL